MVLFEAGFWERMMAVTQGCVSRALWFHKAVCSLKHSAEFCLMSSSQNSQKSNAMPKGSHNQNDSSCQHSGETFNFVGPKLKTRASGWLSGAWSSPSLELKEGVEALELCSAPQQQTQHSQQGPCQCCIAESEQSRSRAQLSLRAESGVPCAAWCCCPDFKAPSSTVSHHHCPWKHKLSSDSLSHAMLFPVWSDQQPVCSTCGLLISSFHSANHVCVHVREQRALSREPAQAILSKQVCSTAKGLHHFQMRDDTESSPLYKLMVCMALHLWSWSLLVSSNPRYSVILCRA